MGMGDVKMLAMIGAFLGWRAVLLTLVLSRSPARSSASLLMVGKPRNCATRCPFGTFLALGALCRDAERRRDPHLVSRLLS